VTREGEWLGKVKAMEWRLIGGVAARITTAAASDAVGVGEGRWQARRSEDTQGWKEESRGRMMDGAVVPWCG
jgi:hypothetical protein